MKGEVVDGQHCGEIFHCSSALQYYIVNLNKGRTTMNLMFDLDGTLTDPRDGIVRSINYALMKTGVPSRSESDLTQFIGPPLAYTFCILLKTENSAIIEQAINWYRERYILKGYLENYVYRGVVEFLEECMEYGHTLYVVTSKRQDIAQKVLDHFELARFFDATHGCGNGPSKSELIEQIMHERDLSPSECVMIGDRKFDIEAGRANNAVTIGVLWGYGTQDELSAAAAEHIVSTPSELLNVINSLNSRS